MKVKNINPIEQHVEKGVLAICVLAAGYLGYTALTSPLQFSDDTGNSVEVRDVENRIHTAVQGMQTQRDKNLQLVRNYQNPWSVNPVNENKDNNIPREWTTLGYSKPFVPQQRLNGVIGPPPPSGDAQLAKIVPMPISPETKPIAVPFGGRFIPTPLSSTAAGGPGAPVPAPVGPAGGPAAPPLKIVEIKALKIQMDYDLAKEFALLTRGEGTKPIPEDQQLDPKPKMVVYARVELQRMEVRPDQTSGSEKWEDIAPPQTEEIPNVNSISATTTDAWTEAIATTINTMRGIILKPRFFQESTAPVTPVKPKPGAVAVAPVVAPPVPPAAAPAVPAVPPVPPTDHGAVPIIPGGGGGTPTPPPGSQPDISATLLPIPPIAVIGDNAADSVWTYDTTAKAGHQYKYRMRVVICNPAYLDSVDKLEPAGVGNRKTLESDWSPESAVVSVPSDQYIYMVSARGGNDLVPTFMVFQWAGGQWNKKDFVVNVGDTVGKQDDAINYGTDFMVVDVRSEGNRITSVVLMNIKDGTLSVRDARSDLDGYNAKEKEIKDAEAARKGP